MHTDWFEAKRQYAACSPWKTASEFVSLVSSSASLLSFLGVTTWSPHVYFCVLLFKFGPRRHIRKGCGYLMSMGVLFADVAAFECGIGQLDWCNFRYTFSQNGAMLHFMHFCRFLTEVPLSATTGVRWEYVVDMSTPAYSESPSRSASRWQTPWVTRRARHREPSWAE